MTCKPVNFRVLIGYDSQHIAIGYHLPLLSLHFAHAGRDCTMGTNESISLASNLNDHCVAIRTSFP